MPCVCLFEPDQINSRALILWLKNAHPMAVGCRNRFNIAWLNLFISCNVYQQIIVSSSCFNRISALANYESWSTHRGVRPSVSLHHFNALSLQIRLLQKWPVSDWLLKCPGETDLNRELSTLLVEEDGHVVYLKEKLLCRRSDGREWFCFELKTFCFISL